ncbi:MAG: hypothetical protein QM668_01815 [Agriterribacter sp.]|nr:MAG: hypothetical protein BGP13_17710 [Sphingobacteriales bacterium 40-81]
MKLSRASFIYILLSVAISASISCKKIKEEIGTQYIIKVMTDGKWIVEKFTENETDDVTAMFEGYEFQFTADGKVFGYKSNGEQQGTWVGNTNDLTITANFSGVDDPLKKLNGVWKISNNTTKSLNATPFNSSRVAFLKLVKKS